MKRFLYLLIILMVCASAYSQTTTTNAVEVREYAINVVPEAMYFVETREVAQGSGDLILTNHLNLMWYPVRIETWFASAVTSTNTLVHIFKRTEQQFTETIVVTNQFGNLQTNHWHTLTNTVDTYVTNTIATWTNSAEARAVSDPADTKDFYIQKDDSYRYTRSNTNAVWIRTIGRR